jgi:hypothetical protein
VPVTVLDDRRRHATTVCGSFAGVRRVAVGADHFQFAAQGERVGDRAIGLSLERLRLVIRPVDSVHGLGVREAVELS